MRLKTRLGWILATFAWAGLYSTNLHCADDFVRYEIWLSGMGLGWAGN